MFSLLVSIFPKFDLTTFLHFLKVQDRLLPAH